jgi:ribonucleoside-diphosphate reductase alpha chain
MQEAIHKILKQRVFLPHENSWEDVSQRVSNIYPPIYEYLLNMDFIFSSPTLMNACTKERTGTLSSCFTMPAIGDSILEIGNSVTDCMVVTKSGGGIGIDLSTLRSSSESVKGIAGKKSSGPLSFLQLYNTVLHEVSQGGSRRGAGMALLDISHPNILDFINAKINLKDYKRFNLSIKIGNDFYDTLLATPDAHHYVKEVTTGKIYPLKDENGKEITVKELWDKILYNAWLMAEPGIFNKDIAFNRCSTNNLDRIVICNPCAEYVGIPGQSCSLGSINLSHLVENKKFNWEKFKDIIIKATKAINATIDVNNFPLKSIDKITKDIRPIGLGYMGLAHCLYKKGIAYNSREAFKFIKELTFFMTLTSMKTSVELAKEFGAYPKYDYDVFMKANSRFFDNNVFNSGVRDIDIEKLKRDIKKYGVRNSSFTAIAPTGTLSTYAETSSGVEPVFALSYYRKVENLQGTYDEIYTVDKVFKDYLEKKFDEKDIKKILKEVADANGSCQGCDLIPESDKKIFVTAHDLTPKEHLDVLGIVSAGVSLSVSKTINLPNEITVEEMGDIYLEAYKKGIIGVTVYRDGCREGILVHEKSVEALRPNTIIYSSSPKRPKELPCDVHRINAMIKNDKGEKVSENFILFVGLLDGKPYEFFVGRISDVNISKSITTGILIRVKSGQYAFKYDDEILVNDINKVFNSSDYETYSRLVSSLLRKGEHPKYVIEQLTKCPGSIVDFSKAVIRMLKKYIKNGEEASVCNSCGSKKIYIDGCKQCPSCGVSDCS